MKGGGSQQLYHHDRESLRFAVQGVQSCPGAVPSSPKKAFETDGGANQVLPGNPTSLVRNTYLSRPETGSFAGLKRDLSVNLKLLLGLKLLLAMSSNGPSREGTRPILRQAALEKQVCIQQVHL